MAMERRKPFIHILPPRRTPARAGRRLRFDRIRRQAVTMVRVSVARHAFRLQLAATVAIGVSTGFLAGLAVL